MWVDDTSRICGARLVVQVRQYLVAAFRRLPLGHPAGLIVLVAEDDRVRGARLLARRHNLPVAYRPVLLVRHNLYRFDALDAVRALLHYAAGTNGDIRIAHELQALRVIVRV